MVPCNCIMLISNWSRDERVQIMAAIVVHSESGADVGDRDMGTGECTVTSI